VQQPRLAVHTGFREGQDPPPAGGGRELCQAVGQWCEISSVNNARRLQPATYLWRIALAQWQQWHRSRLALPDRDAEGGTCLLLQALQTILHGRQVALVRGGWGQVCSRGGPQLSQPALATWRRSLPHRTLAVPQPGLCILCIPMCHCYPHDWGMIGSPAAQQQLQQLQRNGSLQIARGN